MAAKKMTINEESNIYLIEQCCLKEPSWTLEWIKNNKFARITNRKNNKVMILKVKTLVFVIEGVKMKERGWFEDEVQKYFR